MSSCWTQNKSTDWLHFIWSIPLQTVYRSSIRTRNEKHPFNKLPFGRQQDRKRRELLLVVWDLRKAERSNVVWQGGIVVNESGCNPVPRVTDSNRASAPPCALTQLYDATCCSKRGTSLSLSSFLSRALSLSLSLPLLLRP